MILFAAAAAFVSGFFLSSTNCETGNKSLSAQDGFKVEYADYQPRKLMPDTATIFILPPTGGETPLDRRYAIGLCREGRHVLVIHEWTGMDEMAVDFNLHNRLFGRANRALTMLAEKNPGPLHLLGTSLGALFSISAIARIPQIKKAALIVGGVPFTDIIVGSDTKDMTTLREKRRKEFKIVSDEDYLARLNAVFEWNDLDKLNADLVRDKEILLVIGMRDDGVPTKTQLQLLERWPKSKVIRHESDHFSTIVNSFLFDYYQVKRFVK